MSGSDRDANGLQPFEPGIVGMTLSKFQKIGLATSLASATIFSGATEAHALDIGCQNADTVRTQLKEEGQFVLISAQAASLGWAKAIFTSNSNGTIGYHIEEGKGKNQGQLCLSSKLTNIKANPNSDFSRPSWANFEPNSEQSNWLSAHENRNKEKILLGATIVVKKEDGSEVIGSFMIVTAGNFVPPAKGTIEITNSGSINISNANGDNAESIGVIVNIHPVQPNYDKFAKNQEG